MSGGIIKKFTDRKIIANPHFWIILALMGVLLLLHYPQQLLGLSEPSAFSFIGLKRHAVERVFLLLPIGYAGFVLGMRWGFIFLMMSFVIMIPRVFLISEYFADALLETTSVIVIGIFINLWIYGHKKEGDRRQQMLRELESTNRELKIRTDDLVVSERKYRELFENARDAIWEQDLEGNIANANQSFEALSMFSRNELVGMSVRTFMSEESLNLAYRIKQSLLAGEAIEQPYEQKMIKRDGTISILEMSTSLIMEEGRPAGYVHIARDVTRRDQLNAVLNSMEEGIAIIGQDRKIEFMNPSLIKEFGDGKGEYCYKRFFKLSSPCDNCRLIKVIYGSTEKWENTFGDNSFDITYTPFTTFNQTPGVLATFADITKRKQFERELVSLNNLKEHLLSQKTKQLVEISQEVAKLEEEKKKFIRMLGVVAHDMKSPLSVSQSIISGITGGFYGPVNGEQTDMLERVTQRIEGLNGLINDLIDIPLIETGQLDREMSEISLAEVVESAVNEMSIIAVEKGLQMGLIMPSNLPNVYGSNRRLQQVMNNLLSNALKYSDKGVIVVRASEYYDYVKIEVTDNGIGIPPEELPRLFEDFYRCTNTGGVKGTGLGLSISKRIVEAHGGKIWGESPDPDTNAGSRFNFIIPKYKKRAEVI